MRNDTSTGRVLGNSPPSTTRAPPSAVTATESTAAPVESSVTPQPVGAAVGESPGTSTPRPGRPGPAAPTGTDPGAAVSGAAQPPVLASGGGDVKLKNPVPVHITYFTAVADADGRGLAGRGVDRWLAHLAGVGVGVFAALLAARGRRAAGVATSMGFYRQGCIAPFGLLRRPTGPPAGSSRWQVTSAGRQAPRRTGVHPVAMRRERLISRRSSRPARPLHGCGSARTNATAFPGHGCG